MSDKDEGFPVIPLNRPASEEYGPASMQAEATRLMTAAKEGDRAAFDQLVQALRGRAFTVAKSLVGSREEALDLSQEAFLKTYRARDTFRDGEPFLPWFHRILRNTCFSYLRQQKRLKKHSLSSRRAGDEDAGEWDLVDVNVPAPSDRLEQTERVDAFWTAFRELGARDREILSLRHFEELSYQEIADALAVPIGTVMSRLFHARRRLRDVLGKYLSDAALDASPRMTSQTTSETTSKMTSDPRAADSRPSKLPGQTSRRAARLDRGHPKTQKGGSP